MDPYVLIVVFNAVLIVLAAVDLARGRQQLHEAWPLVSLEGGLLVAFGAAAWLQSTPWFWPGFVVGMLGISGFLVHAAKHVALAALSSPTPVPHVESGLANRVDALAQLESRLRGTKTGLRYNLTTAAAGALSISVVVTALAAGSPLALAAGGGVLGVALWRVRHALRLSIRRGSLEAQIDDLIAEGLPNAADDELKKIGSPSDSDLE